MPNSLVHTILPLEGLRLLVVDDDPDTREIFTVLFALQGAEVIAVASAVAALDSLETLKPDILISDIQLPEEDGYSLLRQVKACAAGAQIPAIAVTGYASQQDRARILAAGFHKHLPKPVDLEELSAVVISYAGPGCCSDACLRCSA